MEYLNSASSVVNLAQKDIENRGKGLSFGESVRLLERSGLALRACEEASRGRSGGTLSLLAEEETKGLLHSLYPNETDLTCRILRQACEISLG